ncbi:LDH2 family malate/lactate/ureidoglycolate dehydrogenase [Alkalihalobacillus xiaoxiensis]|uniref:LDH2 family malate/lactate/ureidoglycolate dehydrogenase n=1 Tax=Shouchella xiaoxiensis TaxID=766895 RepID=A0ABS2SU96_9BACI|nr:Ldh family oxidoreductase [Shouchella xiaoxiensis]MBM7839083.1 LDH2 family malate/lactate/ureidoglycolate dehydrogenase [Shouchella xiaoxiensis]
MHAKKQALQALITGIFEKAGFKENQAVRLADHLVLANLRGIDSHGVSRVKTYTDRIRSGMIAVDDDYRVERDLPSSCVIDGNNQMGILLATDAIQLAVKKAKATGIGIVGIRRSNHCGMLADYVKYAADNDCVALATTNAPPSMAPWGGKAAFFGTNPLAYGIPVADAEPLVFDMATSVVARGKIRLALKNNTSIPFGWAVSKEGKPTDDPTIALDGGTVLPVGGPKGYGLAFFVEVLSALMTGASFGPHLGSLYNQEEQDVGQFFLVFRADLFVELDDFKQRMAQMATEVKANPHADGVKEIFLPGELEYREQAKREKKGIPLTEAVVRELEEVAAFYGVAMDRSNLLIERV